MRNRRCKREESRERVASLTSIIRQKSRLEKIRRCEEKSHHLRKNKRLEIVHNQSQPSGRPENNMVVHESNDRKKKQLHRGHPTPKKSTRVFLADFTDSFPIVFFFGEICTY
jgi:hypothetical protein